jgi:hypothetical protein
MPSGGTNRITTAIVRHLNYAGYKAWRQNNGAVYDPARQLFRKNPNHLLGVPDIIGYCKSTGKFICVEVKKGKDRLSDEQALFLKEASMAGCIAMVAKSYDDFVTKFNRQNGDSDNQ